MKSIRWLVRVGGGQIIWVSVNWRDVITSFHPSSKSLCLTVRACDESIQLFFSVYSRSVCELQSVKASAEVLEFRPSVKNFGLTTQPAPGWQPCGPELRPRWPHSAS